MQAGMSCFLLTSRDVLMPALFLGEVEKDGMPFADVQAPGGKIYTARLENVLDVEAGRIMLVHRRAEALVQENYEVAILKPGKYRVYNEKKHGAQGGYIVTEVGTDSYACTCPAYGKEGYCKHTGGIVGLLIALANRAQALADHVRTLAAGGAFSEPEPVAAAPRTFEEKCLARGLSCNLDF